MGTVLLFSAGGEGIKQCVNMKERVKMCVCECVCVSEVIKNGSVSPCCHPIHSRSRLHTLWHYLRPEELGFLTVDTGQMESGPFIVQSAALPPLCTAITQKMGSNCIHCILTQLVLSE